MTRLFKTNKFHWFNLYKCDNKWFNCNIIQSQIYCETDIDEEISLMKSMGRLIEVGHKFHIKSGLQWFLEIEVKICKTCAVHSNMNVVTMLVGIKRDLESLREVPIEEIKALIEENKLFFI